MSKIIGEKRKIKVSKELAGFLVEYLQQTREEALKVMTENVDFPTKPYRVMSDSICRLTGHLEAAKIIGHVYPDTLKEIAK